MAEKHMVLYFVAAAVLAGQADGADICEKAAYASLCRSSVKGATEPAAGLQAAIEHLILETKHAKESSMKLGAMKCLDVCKQNYDDAVTDLQKSVQYLTKNDKPSLKISLSAALTDYVTCDDAVMESGNSKKVGDLMSVDVVLRHMAANCLHLASLLK